MEGTQGDVLHNAPVRQSRSSEGRRGRGVAIILGIFLFVGLVALGERAVYDLNRTVNSYTCSNSSVSTSYYNNYDYGSGSNSALRTGDQKLEQCSNYKMTRLFIILAIVVPVLIGGAVLYLKFGFHHGGLYVPLAWSFIGFAFWMFGHLVIETIHFLVAQYSSAGIYVVLLVIVAVPAGLIFVVQRFRQNVVV